MQNNKFSKEFVNYMREIAVSFKRKTSVDFFPLIANLDLDLSSIDKEKISSDEYINSFMNNYNFKDTSSVNNIKHNKMVNGLYKYLNSNQGKEEGWILGDDNALYLDNVEEGTDIQHIRMSVEEIEGENVFLIKGSNNSLMPVDSFENTIILAREKDIIDALDSYKLNMELRKDNNNSLAAM